MLLADFPPGRPWSWPPIWPAARNAATRSGWVKLSAACFWPIARLPPWQPTRSTALWPGWETRPPVLAPRLMRRSFLLACPCLRRCATRCAAHGITLDLNGAAPGERAYLLRVTPGSALPGHGHRGAEITCVLSGHFHDSGWRYGAGDVAEMDAGQDHEPIAEPGEACICLIATQGRLRMHGLMARLLQPLVGV